MPAMLARVPRPDVRLSTGRPVSQYAGNEGCSGLAGAEPHALFPGARPIRLHHPAAGLTAAELVAVAKQVIRSYPGSANLYRWLAAALGQLGRIEEAKEALEKAITILPELFARNVREYLGCSRKISPIC
jgi:adenylate cyclase